LIYGSAIKRISDLSRSGITTDSVGAGIDRDTAVRLSSLSGADLLDLFSLANRARERSRGKRVDLCAIVNAKSGACPEDCSFCAQSARHRTGSESFPLLAKSQVLEAALCASDNGAGRFCIVCSGRRVSDAELEEVCALVSGVKALGLLPCATLGLLDKPQLQRLREAGLERYHHNLETSEEFFSEICSTHTYSQKVRTISDARKAGLSVCSGGIFGLGESWEDRIDMAIALRGLGVDSVPVNFLTPIKGTPLGDKELLSPVEALKIISVYRLILPRAEIRVCGGRQLTLRELNSMIYYAGADGLLIGNYLTTTGRNPVDDLQLIRDLGLDY
jgi:biotin synthase